jgi:hypothetical protein
LAPLSGLPVIREPIRVSKLALRKIGRDATKSLRRRDLPPSVRLTGIDPLAMKSSFM